MKLYEIDGVIDGVKVRLKWWNKGSYVRYVKEYNNFVNQLGEGEYITFPQAMNDNWELFEKINTEKLQKDFKNSIERFATTVSFLISDLERQFEKIIEAIKE